MAFLLNSLQSDPHASNELPAFSTLTWPVCQHFDSVERHHWYPSPCFRFWHNVCRRFHRTISFSANEQKSSSYHWPSRITGQSTAPLLAFAYVGISLRSFEPERCFLLVIVFKQLFVFLHYGPCHTQDRVKSTADRRLSYLITSQYDAWCLRKSIRASSSCRYSSIWPEKLVDANGFVERACSSAVLFTCRENVLLSVGNRPVSLRLYSIHWTIVRVDYEIDRRRISDRLVS